MQAIKDQIISMCVKNLKVKKDAVEAALTETDLIATIMKLRDSNEDGGSTTSSGSDISKKIEDCKKNIALWQKKLDEGKVKDSDKQTEKIEKEQKKLDKLLAKAEPKVVEKPKVEPKAAEKPKEEKPKKEKRIGRFSAPMVKDLTKVLSEVAKIEYNDAIKKEYLKYIEDLAEDDYKASTPKQLMIAFANLKAPAEEAEEAEEEEEEEDIVEKSDSVVLTLPQLQAVTIIATLPGEKGEFWDADKGRNITGPEADEDEDFDEVSFDGKDYVVGVKTGRVYEAHESGDDFTGGYIGVGKFRNMKK